jgi:hypothetical protein
MRAVEYARMSPHSKFVPLPGRHAAKSAKWKIPSSVEVHRQKIVLALVPFFLWAIVVVVELYMPLYK